MNRSQPAIRNLPTAVAGLRAFRSIHERLPSNPPPLMGYNDATRLGARHKK